MPDDTKTPVDCFKLAREFLALHEGRCSVKAASYMGIAFSIMAEEGEVRIEHGGTPGYINIYAKEKAE